MGEFVIYDRVPNDMQGDSAISLVVSIYLGTGTPGQTQIVPIVSSFTLKILQIDQFDVEFFSEFGYGVENC